MSILIIFVFLQVKILGESKKELIQKSFDNLILTQQLQLIKSNLTAEFRAFLLTGNPNSINIFNKLSDQFAQTFQSLRAITKNTEEQILLRKIEKIYFEYIVIRKNIFGEDLKKIKFDTSEYFYKKVQPSRASLDIALGELAVLETRQLNADIRADAKLEDYWQLIFLFLFIIYVIGMIFSRYILVRLLKSNRELIILQEEAEQQMNQNKERLQQAVSVSHLGYFDHDQINDTVYWSPEMKEICGWNIADNPTSTEFINIIHTEDRNQIDAAIRKAHDPKGDGKFKVEHRIILPNENIRWIRTRSQTFFMSSPTGRQAIRTIGASLDITEYKHLEESLLKATKSAETANISKSEFLANISHEIRTPMNVILGFVNLLSDKTINAATHDNYLEHIKKNGELLIYLIDDILEISKNEANNLKINKQAFSVISVVEDIRQTFEADAKKKDIKINIEILNPIPEKIISDPNRLKQILVNLIGNAIKFTTKGLITIRINFLDPLTSNEASLHNPSIIFEIEDSGIGISAENQTKLFQPFVQADSSVKKRFGGTSLGLALSKRIAKSLGGDLILKNSQPDKGSCFQFTIETGNIQNVRYVKTVASNKTGHSFNEFNKSENHHHLDGKKILIVEDSADNELLIRLYLDAEGAKYDVAHNGFQAIEKATKSKYDVILMDIQMPDLDGLEATKRLRAQGYKRPIIALSAYALNEERERSIKAGCNSHLIKPINKSDLTKEIERQIHASI